MEIFGIDWMAEVEQLDDDFQDLKEKIKNWGS